MIRFTPNDERLGYIPEFLNEDDPRPAAEQFDEAYAHGGSWRPMSGWKFDPETRAIKYPGDPALFSIAFAELREELILVYPYAWVAIVQKDGSFEVARMD